MVVVVVGREQLGAPRAGYRPAHRAPWAPGGGPPDNLSLLVKMVHMVVTHPPACMDKGSAVRRRSWNTAFRFFLSLINMGEVTGLLLREIPWASAASPPSGS